MNKLQFSGNKSCYVKDITTKVSCQHAKPEKFQQITTP